jgi:hypothetical protein
VDVQWTPETRDGDFVDYNFDIAVFSMQEDSPAVRLQKLTNIFNTFILPAFDIFREQGAYIDAKQLMDFIAKNANLPILSDIVKFMDAPPAAPLASEGLPQPDYVSRKSPVTKHTYERINRPGSMSERGKNAVLSQILLGGKPQQADVAGLNIGRAE